MRARYIGFGLINHLIPGRFHLSSWMELCSLIMSTSWFTYPSFKSCNAPLLISKCNSRCCLTLLKLLMVQDLSIFRIIYSPLHLPGQQELAHRLLLDPFCHGMYDGGLVQLLLVQLLPALHSLPQRFKWHQSSWNSNP